MPNNKRKTSIKHDSCIISTDKTRKTSYVSTIDELVEELRNKFLERYQKEPQDYDPIDIEKIKNVNFFVKRFLTYQNLDIDLALEQLDTSMKWRKTYGVNQLDYSRCGIEFFKCAALFIYNEDIEGRPVLYARVRIHIKIPELDKLMKDTLVITLNQLDRISKERGFTVVMDVSGAGLRNVDLGLARFLINTMRSHFPESLKSVIVYNLPFILKGFIPIVKLMLGEKYAKMLKTATGEELFNYINRDNVPKYLGGNCLKDFTQPPDGCTLKAEELAHLYGMTSDSVRKYIDKFQVHINEAKLLVNFEN